VSQQLVAAALAGDRSAWAGIWDLHGPQLHSYAWRLLGNDADAQDAVADTFVSAAENLHQLRDHEQLRPWLYAICRGHVQRRWQQRDRVRPTDDMVSVVDAQEPVVNALGIDAAEATSLLWEAAEGLGQAERELLQLVLTAELDSGEVARITGDKPDAVYVRISRLKDGLGRAAGALLVARHHRADCTELDQLLRDWDGVYSALWRKRIARHVDGCHTCGDSRTTAAGALFGIAGAGPVLALALLRDRVLRGESSPDMVPVSFEAGWPVAEPWERKRRALPWLAAALAALLVVVAVVLTNTGTTTPQPTALTTAAPTTPAAPSTAAPSTAPPTTKPATPRSATPRPTGKPVVQPTPAPTPARSSAPPLPAAPTVSLALSRTAIQTACGSPTTSTATATVSGTGTTTTIRWNGTAPGSRTFSGSGSATVGPYSSVASSSGTDTVTVTATVKDVLGRTATATRTLTVSLAPC
jgi:RNA polymerase sigma factor (sigma-70 family)